VNSRTRHTALFAIAAIAIAASVNALAHSYAGLYAWALHHRLTGWQAVSWPAEIDVFLAVGELALYVAYLDGWPVRQRIWPWATTVVGLVVSVAGNVGHIQPLPGHPVVLADRLTAAASPLAAFAGLTVGLLVLRMNRQYVSAPVPHAADSTSPTSTAAAAMALPLVPSPAANGHATVDAEAGARHQSLLLRDAVVLCQTAAAAGERLSQRALARGLRGRGHRFPNQSVPDIAVAAGLGAAPEPVPRPGR
jgi:hypothetical protein